MSPLKQLQNNTPLIEALKEFFQDQLDTMILKRAYEGMEVKDIAEAKKVIDKSFSELEVILKPNEKKNLSNAK
jgi:GTP1/Obg family GTP-binding protein